LTFRPRGRRLGVVEAPDQAAAVEKAIETFRITDANRIGAQRMSDE
jgi:hypothetical protein